MTILDELVAEIRHARGPVRSKDLADRLGIAPSALDGMLTVLVANGTLATGTATSGDAIACSGAACGATCVGADECAFTVSVPSTHHLVIGSAS
jgi:hypothetical protein